MAGRAVYRKLATKFGDAAAKSYLYGSNEYNLQRDEQGELKSNFKDLSVEQKAALLSKSKSGLDHGELNIPGRTNKINQQLDAYKAQQAKEQKTASQARAALKKQALAAYNSNIDKLVDKLANKPMKNGSVPTKAEVKRSFKDLATAKPDVFMKMISKEFGGA
jgi:hypothetical protein